MKTITVNVTPEIADYFDNANEREKNRMETYMNAWLAETYCKKTPNERLWDIMEKTSAEAISNGYKPEMIEEILKDDE
jgi:hypothetical protein